MLPHPTQASPVASRVCWEDPRRNVSSGPRTKPVPGGRTFAHKLGNCLLKDARGSAVSDKPRRGSERPPPQQPRTLGAGQAWAWASLVELGGGGGGQEGPSTFPSSFWQACPCSATFHGSLVLEGMVMSLLLAPSASDPGERLLQLTLSLSFWLLLDSSPWSPVKSTPADPRESGSGSGALSTPLTAPA